VTLIPASISFSLVCALTMMAPRRAGAVDEAPWEISPYRVRVTLAVETNRRPQAELQETIGRTIAQRMAATLRPRWRLELNMAADAAMRRYCRDPRETAWEDLPRELRAFDKLVWLGVEAVPTGYRLTCREFDAYTRRWGPVLRRDVSQAAYLAEAAFRLMTDAFTPLARVEPLDHEGRRAMLTLKGGALPRPPGADLLMGAGDVFLPLWRRTDRNGELVAGGLTNVPWTYLIAAKEDQAGWLAEINSALRRPLSVRRRGMIQQIAVGLRHPPDAVRVRFFARSDRGQGLRGYEVFREAGGESPPELLGVTDRDGFFVLPARYRGVTTLLLRSDGQVLARLLVAPGAAETIDAPIADDPVRLAAQAEVEVVREELIDVVARRAIMTVRVKSLLKQGRLEDARELMAELSQLPGRSAFASKIDAVLGRLPESEDARVRQTVHALFDATRELLTRFLDSRTITNLQAEVNEAARGGS
jgi:hypothetical protein